MKKVELKQQELWLDITLMLIPWLVILSMYFWGKYFGPNATPPWPIGNGEIHGFSLVFIQGIGCGLLLPIFVIVRYIIHKGRLGISLFSIASGILAGLIGPVFAFA